MTPPNLPSFHGQPSQSSSQPFHFQRVCQLCQEQSFVHCSIKPADALQAAHQNLTDATEQAVENPTLECHVQSCHNESHKLTSLFVPLPNKIETPVNVDNLSIELNDYPFPDLKDYLLCGFHQGFHLGYTGPRFSITLKNIKFFSDNKAHVTIPWVRAFEFMRATREKEEGSGELHTNFCSANCSCGTFPSICSLEKLSISHLLSTSLYVASCMR